MFLRHEDDFIARLNEVEQGENENPYQIHKVPIQSDFLNGFVGSSSIENTGSGHDGDDYIDNNPTKYVKSVKPSDGEKQIGEIDHAGCAVSIQERITAPPCTIVV
jgi:hypothetical protein